MKILGTGLSGLVGSRIVELLNNYQFQNLSRETGIDITNKDQIESAIATSSANIILHLAAFTDVDGAEKEKDLNEQSLAWKINVEGTRNVLEACRKNNKKIIYFSTDMVFSGTKELPEKYSEDEIIDPVGFYAKTKQEAEKLIEKASCPWLILRIAYPYRANFGKKEYVRNLKDMLQNGRQVKAVSDHYFTPTFIDDLANVIDLVVKENLTGKLHAVGDETVSPFDASLKIAELFGFNKDLVEKTTREEFFKNRAPRAYNLSLNNDKIEKLGIKMKTFEQGLFEIQKQIKEL